MNKLITICTEFMVLKMDYNYKFLVGNADRTKLVNKVENINLNSTRSLACLS